MKTRILLLASLAVTTALRAQMIFSYGNKTVDKKEFLAAYNKSGGDATSPVNYREYLELYSRYKLKVQAAYDLRYDTLAAQKKEFNEYKGQLAESYTGLDSIVNAMSVQEFNRSQKDIELGLIIVPVPYGAPADSLVQAEKRIRKAYDALQSGQSFEDVAMRFSGEPQVQTNKGNAGYITAFVLPYEIENVVYNTPVDQYSAPFLTKSGWLIVQNKNERPALGNVVVSQILIGYPEEDGLSGKLAARKQIDSIYQAIKLGSDFAQMARQFSHDLFSFQEGGRLPAFGAGTYDIGFEKQAFSLAKAGDLTGPFETANGFHILRLEKKLPPKSNYEEAREEIQQSILQSDRMSWAQARVVDMLKQQTGFRSMKINSTSLRQFTEQVFLDPRAGSKVLKPDQVLFSVASKPYVVRDFAAFIREKSGSEETPEKLYEGFVERAIKDQYRKDLEQKNPVYRAQLKEFRDANLLFAIMQHKVWNAATEDEKGLKAYYEKDPAKYKWEASAEAVLFSASDENIAESFKEKLKRDPSNWRTLVDTAVGIQADSGRYELGQIPVADRTAFAANLITSNQKTENEPTVNFAYLIRLYPAGQQKKFEDARGAVIGDYQNYLEEKWLAVLKKKYPVKINEAAVQSLK